jgi:hypothetical protein
VEIRTRGKVIGQMVDSFTFYLAREVSVEKCDQTKNQFLTLSAGPAFGVDLRYSNSRNQIAN